MLSLETKAVVHTRDVGWLNQTWGSYKSLPMIDRIQEITDEASESDQSIEDEETPIKTLADDEGIDNTPTQAEEPIAQTHQVIPTRMATRSQGIQRIDIPETTTRVERELHRLGDFNTPGLKESAETQQEMAELALITTMSGGADPTTFEQAWNHPDPIHRASKIGGTGIQSDPRC